MSRSERSCTLESASREGATPHPRSRWTRHRDVRLHYLDGQDGRLDGQGGRLGGHDPRLPLVFVPGFGEEALDHTALLEALSPRRVLIPDLRGRGPSDAPETGYTLADHVGDLGAVMDDAAIPRVHVACYSRGAAYALKWAIEHPNRVASIAIGDYPAEHIQPPRGSAAHMAAQTRFGRPMTDRIGQRAMRAIFREAVNEDYYDAIGRIPVPLLLIRGGKKRSLIDEATLARYRACRPDLQLETFHESAHDLWVPDPTRLARCLARFADATEA